MSKLTDDIIHHCAAIDASLHCLIAESDKLEVRLHTINRTAHRLCYVALEEDVFEEGEQLEHAIAHHEAIASDISHCISQIEKEVHRIRDGYSQACELPVSAAKRVLVAYIADDAALSLVNIRRTRREYQLMFVRLRELAAFWI